MVYAGDSNEPMVNWPMYGLSVPLEVQEQSVGQHSRESMPKSMAKAPKAKARGIAARGSQMQAFVP